MLKKLIVATLFLLEFSICLSQEIVVLKHENHFLTLSKSSNSLTCSINPEFESFRYSSDRQFLIFQHIDKKYKAAFYTDFVKLSDAYEQCRKHSNIQATRELAGDDILDINQAGRIYLTYLQDMYKSGTNTLAFRTSIAVKRLPTAKEIIFPFSIRKGDSESMARQRMGHLDHRISYDSSAIPDDIRVISKNGKYIAPAGISCDSKDPYEGVWSIGTRKKIAAKEIDGLKHQNIQCKDLFGQAPPQVPR